MTMTWGRLVVRALVAVAVAGLLVPLAGSPMASAVTSEGYVYSGLYRAGIAQFYSGNDGEHGTPKGGAGFNSFVLTDLDCGDELTISVSWEFGFREGVKDIPPGLCRNGQRSYGFKIDYETQVMEKLTWQLRAKEADGDIRFYGPRQKDWLGSISKGVPEGGYFKQTAVYHDDYDGQLGITASVWPTEETKNTVTFDSEEIEEMWRELVDRTPLPEHVNRDEVESMFKQLACHAVFAYGAPAGAIGDSWDFESWRANISMSEALFEVTDHECNWGKDGDQDSNIPPDDRPEDLPPSVDAGPDVAGDEGAAVSLRGSATDDAGQPATSWTYEPVSGVDAGATCDFADKASLSTTLTCTDDGEYRVTLTADDGVNEPVSDSAVLTVRNVAPTLTLQAPENWAVYRVQDQVTLAAPFTDPGTNDTHTCSVSWDDGSTSTFPAEGGNCSRERTFDHAGMYTMKVTVTDDDGGTDSAEVMVVVYDPRAGLLTGTGQVADGTAFTAVGKYLTTDSTTPFGTFALHVPEEQLTFTTTKMEWLVITPDGKSAIKGTAGGYGFVAYLTPTGFRAVVWPLSAGPIPPGDRIYDTSPEAGYDVDVAKPRPLTTGVVVIDSGWVPGLPLPIGDVLGDVLPEVSITVR